MEEAPKKIPFKWELGEEMISLEVHQYSYGDRLYVGMTCYGEEGPEPFADVTVNLPGYLLEANEAFISGDLSNDLLKFIKENKVGDWSYWRDQGAEVRRSERRNPIIILEPGKEYTREDGSTGQYYNAKEVYDISQTTARDRAQPQVSLDDRLVLKALIYKSPVPIRPVEQLPDAGLGAMFDPEQDAILVKKGMDAPDIFRCVSLALAHVELEAANPDYSRSEEGYKAYCVSYMLCKKYGIDTRGYDVSALNDVFTGRDPKEIGGELSEIKEAASSINFRMAKVLEQSRTPRHQEQER